MQGRRGGSSEEMGRDGKEVGAGGEGGNRARKESKGRPNLLDVAHPRVGVRGGIVGVGRGDPQHLHEGGSSPVVLRVEGAPRRPLRTEERSEGAYSTGTSRMHHGGVAAVIDHSGVRLEGGNGNRKGGGGGGGEREG